MTRPRRILFVDHTAVLGGAELSLLDLATSLRAECAVALFEDGPLAAALVTEGVALLPVAAPDALNAVKKGSARPTLAAMVATAAAAVSLARIARPFDVLHANSLKSFLVSAGAGVLARRPVIWHLRDILDRGHFSAANIRVLVFTANSLAARVVANSRATADAFIAAGGRADLVRVVHNGIDGAPYGSRAPDVIQALRASLGLPGDAFVVGSFSRLNPWKGQHILLDALEHLPDVHAIIAGGALFSGESAYERDLRIRASQPPLAGRVHILGARHDVPTLIAACDVVAHTSVLPEPFGRVLVEALLSKRPLIASDAGGVREIVRDGVTAFLVPPGDARRLASAVQQVRDDPARAAAMALAGRDEMRHRFTRDAMVAGVRAVVDDVVRGPAG